MTYVFYQMTENTSTPRVLLSNAQLLSVVNLL
jgi:hypothetical protein